jgi:hypothetical protein
VKFCEPNFCKLCKIQCLSSLDYTDHVKNVHRATIGNNGCIQKEFCSCGKKALYRVRDNGYCSEHRQNAIDDTKQQTIRYDGWKTSIDVAIAKRDKNDKNTAGFQVEYRIPKGITNV